MKFHLMLTAAIVLAGEIQTPGTLLRDVDEDQAKSLLHRGRARLPTAEELAEAGLAVPPEAHEVVATPVKTPEGASTDSDGNANPDAKATADASTGSKPAAKTTGKAAAKAAGK
jgi:hypothetical protein